MSIGRILLGIYRKLQYRIYGRTFKGIMSPGKSCIVEDMTPEITHGDVVHPCVRYCEDGFEGHHWWMVYTPYYKADASLENPVLCYGCSEDASAPTEWKYYCNIQRQHAHGYNSDPTMFFQDGRLFVFWRENETPNTDVHHCVRATFGCEVKNKTCFPIDVPLLIEQSVSEDIETCPTILPHRDGYIAYAMHLRFFSPSLRSMHGRLGKLVNRLALLADLLGIYSQQRSYGLSIWKGKTLGRPFEYDKTLKFRGVNKLYRPWHMDFFDWQGKRYAIVQTNQSNSDLALAVSDDYEHFTFFKRPIITNTTIGKLGIYKPTAGIIGDRLYLYYTAQDYHNRALNKLYLTEMNFTELLSFLE